MSSTPADRSRSAGARPGRPPGPAPVAVAPPAAGHHRVRLTLAYDGSGFHGMAANDGVRTVAGTLLAALAPLVGPVELSIAGRTDAGVHAHGQVVSFDVADDGPDPVVLQQAANARCAPDLVVREATLAEPTFDARFSARSRTYRYTVLDRPVPDPFLARTALWVPHRLDLPALRLACDPLIGVHDFSSFCRRPKRQPPASLERRVLDARWERVDDDLLRFEITATAFCHQMVRSLVGTLVEVGMGKRRAGEVSGILRARDRHAAGQVAPPHGLCLWSVAYA